MADDSARLAALFLLLAAVAGCGEQNAAPTVAGDMPRHSDFLVKQGNGVYFGALVNPLTLPYWEQEAEVETLEGNAGIGRTLALHNEFRTWRELAAISATNPDPEIQGDVLAGRVPVVALRCADDMTPGKNGKFLNLEEIASGKGDADLAQIRAALSTITYSDGKTPYPIMLRWFWEFNLNAANPNHRINGNEGCFIRDPNKSVQAQFKNAWTHIYSKLSDPGGTPDITFIWDPDVSLVSNDGLAQSLNPVSFYPGRKYVDWIGVDGYSMVPLGGGNPRMFDDIFRGFINVFGYPKFGKPVIITETASCASYAYPYDQGDYIADAESKIDDPNGIYAGSVFGFEYFDAYVPGKDYCDWRLTTSAGAPAIPGMRAFKAMGAGPSFGPMVTPPP